MVYIMSKEKLGKNQMILGFDSDKRFKVKPAKFNPGKKVVYPNGISYIDTRLFS